MPRRENSLSFVAAAGLRAAVSSGLIATEPLGIEMTSHGSTILPVSLPPPSVSVRLSIV